MRAAVGIDRPVDVGIDAAIERRDLARAECRAQLLERLAAGVAQHEIEGAEPVAGM